MAEECERVAKKIVDLMWAWHDVIDEFKAGRIDRKMLKSEQEAATIELAELLKRIPRECK